MGRNEISFQMAKWLRENIPFTTNVNKTKHYNCYWLQTYKLPVEYY